MQETLLKAWMHRSKYDEQQKLRAWLMTILVHLVISHKRRAWRLQFTDDMTPFETGAPGNQFDALYLKEVLAKMVELPLDQLDAIIFLAHGEQYDEAGNIMETATGTIKSRATRIAGGRRVMAFKHHTVEPIMTAPRDQGRLLTVVLRGVRRNDVVVTAYWWRHWTMPEGCWWSPERGMVEPVAWLVE